MGDVPLIVPSLTIPSTTVVASAIPGLDQAILHPDKVEKNTADEKKLDWKSTASATVKLFLRGVRDSADAFGPLKSVAGGLCFILENYEVWSFAGAHHLHTHACSSERRQMGKK